MYGFGASQSPKISFASSSETEPAMREDAAVGWEALDRWGEDVARIEPFTGVVCVIDEWSVHDIGLLALSLRSKWLGL